MCTQHFRAEVTVATYPFAGVLDGRNRESRQGILETVEHWLPAREHLHQYLGKKHR